MMENSENATVSTHPRRRLKRWHVILLVLFALLVIASGIILSQWRTLNALTTGSNFTGGAAGVAAVRLPSGFHSSVFYSGLASPRLITFSPDGTLFVAERGAGSIVALPDPQHTGKANQRIVVVSGLNDPTSLDFYQGALYVGEATQISRFTITPDFKVSSRQVVVPNLPTGGSHITRTVLIGPDGNLYVSIGSSCNICIETNQQRATVWQYHLDGSNGRLYSRGLRNAVGLAINPWNNQIWATNNGRDLMGDNIPPETVYALQDGGNYGWPLCHAGNIIDPDFGHAGDCNGVIAPLVKMQAHSAPLGLAFYKSAQFPQQYHGLYIAFHGSWNRSVPTGYKVVFVPLNDKGQIAGPVRDFATGWLTKSESTTGRPVGLAVGPDGALYVSDDKAGIIYRIAYTG
ncbi:MAG TPA: PQQ-dependent sugar dehydrogenase [Ktedonobacteraceae bacterium]|nr:PQQ-dependent sugar dehydrogenase [Ktedonobacteraceae bacterium]